MKYQIGDEIIVLHSNEEGHVVDIMNEQMVMIEVRGVRFPAYMDQIDFPYFYRFSKKKVVEEKKPAKVYIDNIPKEKPQPSQSKVADGVWLTIIPKFGLDEFNDDIVEQLKIYLVNRTADNLSFTYLQKFGNTEAFALKNEIAAFHQFYLHDIAFEDVNDSPNFFVDFSLVKPNKLKADHFETTLKLKPKQIFQKIELLKEKNLPSIEFKLLEQYPNRQFEEPVGLPLDKLSKAGFKIYNANQAKEHIPAPRTVIDLHIEKITNHYQHLSNFEILTLQLKEFEKWYDIAVANRLTSFIVIHGVGTGKLKEELHEILKTKPEVKNFINQYDSRFGYGATEIFFK